MKDNSFTLDKKMKMSDCLTCPVRRWSIFSELLDTDLAHLPIQVEDTAVSADTCVSKEGDLIQQAFVLRQGSIKLERVTVSGGTQIVQLLRNGDIWGFEGLDQSCYQHTATTLENSLVCRINISQIRTWCDQDSRVQSAIRKRLQIAHRELENHLLLVLSADSVRRVAAFLCFWCRNYPDNRKVSFPFHRHEIADFLSISPTHVSRILADFKRRGLVHESNGRISVSYHELRNIANGTHEVTSR
ncbi:Crp/Fnr family transcriptional regulator [Candidatus Igneacidithiobacillus taiwanensis]|uniref:Crp/Fnr family transcriptional regulator n=1 Tax=Candidatus Igneacidithiobacillus taiwanensis TaxID=1945924 RepID=UPI0028975ACA|nr:Crp/Fnr family transcriptional regulator [Candidatus Igneacidithiobacillus taiwanensis]